MLPSGILRRAIGTCLSRPFKRSSVLGNVAASTASGAPTASGTPNSKDSSFPLHNLRSDPGALGLPWCSDQHLVADIRVRIGASALSSHSGLASAGPTPACPADGFAACPAETDALLLAAVVSAAFHSPV